MEESILNSTKKILGVGPDYNAFDIDIITHINAAFSVVNQLGIGPTDGFMIEDAYSEWGDLQLPMNQQNLLKTYIFLKVRLLFDPPTSGFLLDAMNKQVEEYESRLSYMREATVQPVKVVGNARYDEGYEAGYLDGWTTSIQDSVGPYGV
jgi:hypothetical protein